MHFSSGQLVTLFSKLKLSVSTPLIFTENKADHRVNTVADEQRTGSRELDDHREVNEAFWAQVAGDRPPNRDGDDPNAGERPIPQ